eukprot:g10810.t1
MQPVVAKVKLNKTLDLFYISQAIDHSARESSFGENSCSKAFPNCCAKIPVVDESKIQTYAGIQYTNMKLNITTTIPSDIAVIENNKLQLCPIGTSWKVENGITKCYDIFCEAGNEVNGYICVPCLPGFFKSVRGTHRCSKCSENSFSTDEGALHCTVCEKGRAMVKNEVGKYQCKTCPTGKYQNAIGQSSCIPCPINTYSPTSMNTFLVQCLKCSDFAQFTTTNGSIGVAIASKGCMCRGKLSRIGEDVGFYRNKDESIVGGDDYCLRCPDGAFCANSNTTVLTMETQPGYFRKSKVDTAFYPCHVTDHCTGGSFKTGPDDQCLKGHTGILCAICGLNYVSVEELCVFCPNGTSDEGKIWMVVVFGILYVLGFFLYLDKVHFKVLSGKKVDDFARSSFVLSAAAKMKLKAKARQEEALEYEEGEIPEEIAQAILDASTNTLRNSTSKFFGRLKILLGYVQIIAAMNFSVNVPWPKLFLLFISFAKFLNIDFMKIAALFSPCSFKSNFLEVFYLHMLVLPLIFLFTAIAFCIARCRTRYHEKVQAMFNKTFSLLNFIVFLLYPGISTRIFRLLKCRHIGNTIHLEADFTIMCWEGDHAIAIVVGILCSIVYIFGIPIIIVCIVYINKDKLDHASTMTLFGPLYLSYERQYWYWESVEMLKKMVLAGGLVIVAPESSAQVLIGTLVTMSYLLVTVRFQPYDDQVEDNIQIITSIQILLYFIIGLVLRMDSEDEYEKIVVGTLLVTMNGIVILISLSLTAAALPKLKFNVNAICSKKQVFKNEKSIELNRVDKKNKKKQSRQKSNNTLIYPKKKNVRETATLKIQALHRGSQARKRVEALKEETRAATKIQSIHRGVVARKITTALKKSKEESDNESRKDDHKIDDSQAELRTEDFTAGNMQNILKAYFLKHDKKKIKHVDKFIAHFDGKLDVLVKGLEKKYGEPVNKDQVSSV